tara:strand:+ start:313 stop:537 length:225 start_codon:yes stop_codon:yes gene_type:complete
MLHEFEDANVAHTTGPRFTGDAAVRVIAPADFDAAVQEITRWDGYEPTPLIGLATRCAMSAAENSNSREPRYLS